MNDLYKDLYNRAQELVAKPVPVANPDPLHNRTTIIESGIHDVSSYAEINVNVEEDSNGGDSSGGIVGSILNKKISITIISNLNYMFTWAENYFISENGYVSSGAIEIPENSQIVRDLIIPIPMNSPNYYFGLPMINPSYNTVAASDPVNCTFNFSGGEQYLVVTDPTMDASVTLTYSHL